MSPHPRFVAVVAIVALLSGFLPPSLACAHAYPTTSSPSKDATVQTAPGEVVIEFDDELEPKFSSIVVHDAKGATVSAGAARVSPADPKHLSVALKTLKPGSYTVIWHATDTDTHKTEGRFTFKFAP